MKLSMLILAGVASLLVFSTVGAGLSGAPASQDNPPLAAPPGFLPLLLNNYRPPLPALNKIVYASGYTDSDQRMNLYTMAPDGSNPTPLTFGSAQFVTPAWSPDGSKIAYTVISGDQNYIQVMNADGSGTYTLVNLPGHHFHPTWSPDGSQIAFTSDLHNPGPETPNDIYVINADGSGTTLNLTNSPTVHEDHPNWSPDGMKIAYTNYSGSDYSVVEIYAMNADGSNPVNLTNSGEPDFAPDWSPDGARIAFYRTLGSGSSALRQIFIMNADGSGQTRLTFTGGQCWYPNWSPDGSQVAFQMYTTAYADIYVINADGSGLVNLTNSGSSYASVQPDWK